MSQHKERKQRTCKHCRAPIYSTAKEIKEHAEKCSRRKKQAA